MKEIFEILEQKREQKNIKLLTVIEGEGFGAKALVLDDVVEREIGTEGFFKACEHEISHIKEEGIHLLSGKKVFCDILENEMKIVICGAGHVAMPVIRIGRMLGAHVTVIEDREYFANMAKENGASEVICEPYADALDKIEGSKDTYFILLTRGHSFDQLCLEKIVKKQRAYVGMLGSRKRMVLVKEYLAGKGIFEDEIGKIHAPIGLDINAESPVEVAIAVLGEIIKVKKQSHKTTGFTKELLSAITRKDNGSKVIATILERNGSAPRAPGTKMVVTKEECIGTVGGGFMEGEVIKKARQMLENGEPAVQICTEEIYLTDKDSQKSVFGGRLSIILEAVFPDEA